MKYFFLLSLLFLNSCKATWLGPMEPLDSIVLQDNKTGKQYKITYGFYHNGPNMGYVIWKKDLIK